MLRAPVISVPSLTPGMQIKLVIQSSKKPLRLLNGIQAERKCTNGICQVAGRYSCDRYRLLPQFSSQNAIDMVLRSHISKPIFARNEWQWKRKSQHSRAEWLHLLQLVELKQATGAGNVRNSGTRTITHMFLRNRVVLYLYLLRPGRHCLTIMKIGILFLYIRFFIPITKRGGVGKLMLYAKRRWKTCGSGGFFFSGVRISKTRYPLSLSLSLSISPHHQPSSTTIHDVMSHTTDACRQQCFYKSN